MLAFDRRRAATSTLPSREASSLLCSDPGSENMIESSSLPGDGGSAGGGFGRMLAKMEGLLFDGCDVVLASTLAFSSSSLLNGFSMLIKFVGKLGVHRDSPLGCDDFDSVSSIVIALQWSSAEVLQKNASAQEECQATINLVCQRELTSAAPYFPPVSPAL